MGHKLSALAAAAAFAALLLSGPAGPPAAQAAPCTITPTSSFLGGELAISGGSCADVDFAAEEFTVYCSSGAVRLIYKIDADTNDTPLGPACSAPTRIRVTGFSGPNVIDLSLVSAVTGFSSVVGPNELSGGPQADRVLGTSFPDAISTAAGDDRILIRDGRADAADCGAGADNVQADQASLDSLAGCELADLLAEPPAAIQTGQTAAPAPKPRKCKKMKGKKAAAAGKKCRKK